MQHFYKTSSSLDDIDTDIPEIRRVRILEEYLPAIANISESTTISFLTDAVVIVLPKPTDKFTYVLVNNCTKVNSSEPTIFKVYENDNVNFNADSAVFIAKEAPDIVNSSKGGRFEVVGKKTTIFKTKEGCEVVIEASLPTHAFVFNNSKDIEFGEFYHDGKVVGFAGYTNMDFTPKRSTKIDFDSIVIIAGYKPLCLFL